MTERRCADPDAPSQTLMVADGYCWESCEDGFRTPFERPLSVARVMMLAQMIRQDCPENPETVDPALQYHAHLCGCDKCAPTRSSADEGSGE